MSKHRETRGNPNHGLNTLIGKVPETFGLALVTRFHGRRCSHCMNFSTCRPLKGRIDDSNYCHVMSLGWAPPPPLKLAAATAKSIPAEDQLAALRARLKAVSGQPGKMAEYFDVHRQIAQLAGKL